MKVKQNVERTQTQTVKCWSPIKLIKSHLQMHSDSYQEIMQTHENN